MDEQKFSMAAEGSVEGPSEGTKALLTGSETFAYFQRNGIKPPSIKSWKTVLNELGQAAVEGNRAELKAYAEATKDTNLASALRDVRFVTTEDISELDYDTAKEKYKSLFSEKRELEDQVRDFKRRLAEHVEGFKTDAGHEIYIDEYEDKIASAKKRLLEIEDLVEKLEDEFGLTDDVLDE